ncbi:dUTP diphosphatase [Patescibacteria group bacterium]|nr:dUTP diphosphatase [Patescibacteria group bacterium]
MKVKIKRIDKFLEIPQYKTKGAVGFDLLARVETEVMPFEVKLIPLNLVVKVPKGYGLFLFSRSSTPSKKGLIVANSVGVIDQDYNGEEDELKLSVLNVTKKKVVVEKGERICQGIFLKLAVGKFSESAKMGKKSRGGFGTTGHK